MKKILNYIDNKFGRFFFGNDNDFRINLLGSLKRLKLNSLFKTNNFFKYGYVSSGKSNKDYCDELKDHIQKFVNKNFREDLYNYTVPNDEKTIEISKKIFNSNQKLKTDLNSIFGDKFIISDICIYRNYHFNQQDQNNEQYSNFFHCDHYVKTMFKIFIILDDVDENNGPLFFFDKATTKKIIPKFYKNRNEYKPNIDKIFKVNKFTGSKGNALVCSTTECLHKAGVPNKNKSRDMIVYNCFNLENSDPWFYENDLSNSLSKKLGKLN